MAAVAQVAHPLPIVVPLADDGSSSHNSHIADSASPLAVSGSGGSDAHGEVTLLSVYAQIQQHGLRSVLQPGAFDAPTLCRIARECIAAEEYVATGCLLVQSIALVRAWVLLHNKTPNGVNQDVVAKFVCRFYQDSAEDKVSMLSSSSSSSSSSSLVAAVGIDLSWRGRFAVQLYNVVESPDFPALQTAMMVSNVSTLQRLSQKFFHNLNLPLLTMLLEVVTENRIGKHLIAGAIQGWNRQEFMQAMTHQQRLKVIDDFHTRITRCATARKTRLLLHQTQHMWSESEQSALLHLQLQAWSSSHSSHVVAISKPSTRGVAAPASANITSHPTSLQAVIVGSVAAEASDAPHTPTSSSSQPAQAALSAQPAQPAHALQSVHNVISLLHAFDFTGAASHQQYPWEHTIDLPPPQFLGPEPTPASAAVPVTRAREAVAATASTVASIVAADSTAAAPTAVAKRSAKHAAAHSPQRLVPVKNLTPGRAVTSSAARAKRVAPPTISKMQTAKKPRQNSPPQPRDRTSAAAPHHGPVSKIMRAEFSRTHAAAASPARNSLRVAAAAMLNASVSLQPLAPAAVVAPSAAPTDSTTSEEAELRSQAAASSPEAESIPPSSRVRTIAFADRLQEAVPFHPLIQESLAAEGCVVVQPCLRDHAAWMAELNADLLQNSSFRRAYRMSFNCFNDANSRQLTNPAPLAFDVFPPPPVDADIAFAYLEEQWKHWSDPEQHPSAPIPPAGTQDCIYLRDLSATPHDLRRRRDGQCSRRGSDAGAAAISFFPKVDTQLQEYLNRLNGQFGGISSDHQPMELEDDEKESQATFTSTSAADPVTTPPSPFLSFPPLYLDAYAWHRESLLRVCSEQVEGVHTAYAYLKFGFQFFNLHIEQLLLPFVHHQLCGESVWILVPHTERHKLDAAVREMAHVRGRSTHRANKDTPSTHTLLDPVFLYSKSLFPPPSLLRKHRVHSKLVTLKAGQILLAHGGFAHCGFSTGPGETHSFACNILTEDWFVTGGPEFVLQYLEWVLQLSDVTAEELDQALDTMGLQRHHLANALNTCPPAYTCSLIRALRADLERQYGDPDAPPPVSAHATLVDANPPPAARTTGLAASARPHGIELPPPIYTLDAARAHTAMRQLDAILQLLHDSDVRVVLRRAYVNNNDPTLQMCACPDSCSDDLEGGALSPRVLRRFHAWMEREHALVVSSGSLLSSSAGLKRTRGQSNEAGATGVDVTLESIPLSTGFGSVTATPCARLLAFLSSDHIPPSMRLSSRSRFLDIGCGIGQVVLHTQLRKTLASCIGIECVWDRWNAAQNTLERLRRHKKQQQQQEQGPTRRPVDEQREQDFDAREDASAADATEAAAATAGDTVFTELARALDDRLARVQFIHDAIERQPQLVTEATHVFMFDAAFLRETHLALLPLLCSERARIVVTCLRPSKIERLWGELEQHGTPLVARDVFHQLGEETLTMAGASNASTRKVYIYAAQPMAR